MVDRVTTKKHLVKIKENKHFGYITEDKTKFNGTYYDRKRNINKHS